MTLRIVHRPARMSQPPAVPDEIMLAAPPQVAENAQGFPLQSVLPIVGSLSSITMMVLLRNNPMFVVVGAVILVVALVGGVAMAFTSRGAAVRQRRVQRERYLDYLEDTREDLTERTAQLRSRALLQHPDPTVLVQIGQDPAQRWERRPGDADFLRVRIGTSALQALPVRLPPEQNPVQPFDPIMKAAAERIATLGGTVPGMPVAWDLAVGGEMSVVGDRAAAVTAVRAALAQLAAFHAPEDVQVAAVVPPGTADQWQGLDLLPHAQLPQRPAGAVSARRIAPTLDALLQLIGGELRERVEAATTARRAGRKTMPRRLVVVVDEQDATAAAFPRLDSALGLAELGVSVVHLVDDRLKEPSSVSTRLTVAADGTATLERPGHDEKGHEENGDDEKTVARIAIDAVDRALLEVIVRPLTGLRLRRPAGSSVQSARSEDAATVDELLGLDDIDTLDMREAWHPRSPQDFLRVPIGVSDDGAPVLLDLKESAQQGYGPHGICIGATGSGKSELLRTLVLGLALTHGPSDLSMILVDYKGGAAFAPFTRLPHVAGVIDNLADDPQLTERARASINGEVVRRQQLLKQADNSPSITHYRRLRQTRPDLPELPHLFLVIDEFGELLTAEPDFVDLLLTIGRIGRSIGVHLLLSSQRIEGGKLRGLDTYLSYRIGLRTFSEAESQVVLDTPDAFHLPAVPGYGYIKVDTSIYSRFRAGFVSGPVPDAADATTLGLVAPGALPLPAYDLPEREGKFADDAPTQPATGRTLVQAAVERVSQGVPRTRPVWLAPLPPVLTLGSVLPSNEERAHGDLRVPIGLLDEPGRQRQEPWLLDLTRSGGHVTITGAPQSGRSTFLRTLAVALAFTHTPREVSVYGMDLTGGGLARIDGFPHVGGVATRGHRERLLRVLEELTQMLAAREGVFRRYGLDSLADLRRRHAQGQIPELPSADIVLLVDGLGAIRSDFEELAEPIADLLERGGSFGIHVVATLNRWNELRTNQQGLVGTRLELKLNDAGDSQVARKLSAALRADEPGRVLTDDKLYAQVALPLLEESEDGDIGEAVTRLARASAQRFDGQAAAPIRLLPEDLPPARLPDALDEPDAIPIGLRQDTMQPILLDVAGADQHLLVLGDTRCGKTTLLRGIVQGAIDRYSAEDLVIALMDTRGALVDDVPDEYLGGHAGSALLARQLAESIAVELDKRQSDNGTGKGTGKGTGPRILVVADDFDILAAGGTEPLRPLLPYLASARDLRLNVVVSRPVAGASRALFDLALQSVRDTGGSVLVMSGDRSEGQLLPRLYAEPMIPGRGRLARRGQRPALIQVANFTPGGVDAAGEAAALAARALTPVTPAPAASPARDEAPEESAPAEPEAALAASHPPLYRRRSHRAP